MVSFFRVHSRVWLLALGVWGLFVISGAGISAEEQPKKTALPTAAEQERAGKLILELYNKDLMKAEKDRAARAQLALTFLQEAKDTTDDRAGRYMLLRAARMLAAKAGDAPTALQAIDDLAQDFAV